MKNKLFGLLIIGLFLLSGCGKVSEKDALNKFMKDVDSAKSYYLEGKLDIVNNEDIYTYDVKAFYKKDNNYKVELINTVNSHEQIILRNNTGVYVISPKINKSFKFQSDWPYNNSQVYLLDPIVDDIKNDDSKKIEKNGDGFKITVGANYPNNPKLTHEEIFLDKKGNILKVVVLNSDGNNEITMTFNKIDYGKKFDDSYFELREIIDVQDDNSNENINNQNENNNSNDNSNTNSDGKTKETSTIEDVIYPMYLPVNTYLTNTEKVDKEDGQRLILTFDGDNPFMLIEETVSYEKEHLIVPTYGDLELMASSVATLSDNSINWIDNNIEYYVVSDKLSKSELLNIARSISVLPVSK